MDIQVYMFLILTVVVAIALIQATFPAKLRQGGKLPLPELKLFRRGGAMFFSLAGAIKNRKSKIENLKRLLYFIRAVSYSPVGRLPYKLPPHDKSCITSATLSWSGKCCIFLASLSRWVKSCNARAAAKFGNVYEPTAADMVYCSVSEKYEVARRKRSRAERFTGKAPAIVKKMTETLETLSFADYTPVALIKNQKSKIKNRLYAYCGLPFWIVLPTRTGNLEFMDSGRKKLIKLSR